MNLGIYIHIPFCVSKCLYCNFYSENKLEYINDYVLALTKEIKRDCKLYNKYNIDTIFIGGGTPSILPAGCITLIINAIKENYNVLPDCEITIEANPNSINYTNAAEWFSAGVNRVSVGLQTTSNRLLKIIGRAHTHQDFLNAISDLKNVGFTNINADIMIGLPMQKQNELKSTLRQCFGMGLTHISAYTLILEENTPLCGLVQQKKIKLPTEEKTVNMFKYLLKQTAFNGYNRYEVSNFALDGYECKHNKNCWNMVPYVGFGCAAHSFFEKKRFGNISNIVKYIELINNNKSVREFNEEISDAELIEETIMLNLRTVTGINLKKLKQQFNYDLRKEKSKEIVELKNLGLIKLENGFLSATTEGFYVLNQIILKLVD